MATSIIKSGNMQSFYTGEVATYTFNVPANYRGVMFIATSNSAYQGAWIISMGNNGTLYPLEIVSGSKLSISNPENYKITITQADTPRGLRVGFLNLTNIAVSAST